MKTRSLAALALASALLSAACSTPPKTPRGIAASGISMPAPAPALAAAASASGLTQQPPAANARAS